MGKQNIRYYEDLYLDCLRAYLKAKTKEDKLKALKLIDEFKEHGNIDIPVNYYGNMDIYNYNLQ